MFTFGIRIILLLLIIGGVAALLGDYIGRIIGRKRLTLFGLRPRNTAYAITVITGILIVFITMASILTISKDARTALFGLDDLRTEVKEKSRLLEKTKDELALRVSEKDIIDQQLALAKKDLDKTEKDLEEKEKDLDETKENLKKAKKEIATLAKQRQKLAKQVEVARKGRLLFKNGQVLITSIILAGPEKAKLELGLKQILSATDVYIRSFGVTGKDHFVFMSPNEFNQTVASLQKLRGEQIVTVVATRNSLYGEVVQTRFNLAQNKLVYRAGTEIAQATIPSSLSVPEIEIEIKKLLIVSNQKAIEAGVFPDASGSVGRVPYSTIFSLAKKIKFRRKKVALLKTLAKSNTFSIGPLEVDFKVTYQ